DLCGGLLTLKFQVLGDAGDDGTRKYAAVLTDACPVHNGHVGADPRAIFDDNILMDGHKGFNHHIAGNLGLWVYIGKWLYHACVSFTFTICAINSASTTTFSPTIPIPFICAIPLRIGSSRSHRKIIVSPGLTCALKRAFSILRNNVR